jgi:Mn-dependent DtxR family transcriptional regulator
VSQPITRQDRGLATPKPKPDPFAIQRTIRRSALPYAAQALLCAILDHDRYGQSRRGCTASLATLAADIGATPQYVSQLLPDLVKAGWIKAEPRRGNVRPLRMGKIPRAVGKSGETSQEPLGEVLGSKKAQESQEETGGCSAAVETADHLPAFEQFFGRLGLAPVENPRPPLANSSVPD